MQLATEAETDLAFNPDKGDERLKVRFHTIPRKSEEKSLKEGRPVFEDVEYVQIMVPGDKNSIVDRPARDIDRQRFERQYEAFKKGAEQANSGTPLAEWPSVTRSMVEELAVFHVKTVEDLAGLADNHAQRFPGIQALKQKAKDYLERAKANAPAEQMAAALKERDSTIEAMRQQMKEQAEAIAELRKHQNQAKQKGG